MAESQYGNLSTRRKKYLEMVAAVYALEEKSEDDHYVKTSQNVHTKSLSIEMRHLVSAEKCVTKPFEMLEKGMS